MPSDPSELSINGVQVLLSCAERCGKRGVPISIQDCESVVALCRRYLDDQKPAMTAGEFAGLVVSKAKESQVYWSDTDPNDCNKEFIARCKVRADTWERVQALLISLAAAHNIKIVEPKKT